MRCTAGLPFLLREGMEAAFVPPQLDAPRRATVRTVSQIDETGAVVEFEGIDTREAAERLSGCSVLVLRNEVPARPPAPGSELVGLRVLDERFGGLGIVSGVQENPAHPLLEVERPSGAMLLIPLVDAFVHDADAEAGVLRTHVPQGLLEL